MSFLDRIARQKQLGREISIEYSLAKALELNALSLENVAALKAMGPEGWAILKNQMQKDIENKQQIITGLAVDPEKNKNALIVNYAVQETLKRLIAFVDGVLKQETHLHEEQKRLNESATNL